MFSARNIKLHQELLQEVQEKVAVDPRVLKMMLAGGAGLAVGSVPTFLATRAHDEKNRLQTRDHAFGAGMAAGIATPELVHQFLGQS